MLMPNLSLLQNPRERITMSELMKHDWVTMNKKFPLKPSRELRDGETQEVHNGVTCGVIFAEANPKPDFLMGLANISRHERVYQEDDIIIRQGETGELAFTEGQCRNCLWSMGELLGWAWKSSFMYSALDALA